MGLGRNWRAGRGEEQADPPQLGRLGKPAGLPGLGGPALCHKGTSGRRSSLPCSLGNSKSLCSGVLCPDGAPTPGCGRGVPRLSRGVRPLTGVHRACRPPAVPRGCAFLSAPSSSLPGGNYTAPTRRQSWPRWRAESGARLPVPLEHPLGGSGCPPFAQ